MTRALGAARTVVVFGVLLQLAGFLRLLVTAAYFGTGPPLDAYYLALVIPTFVVAVCTGVLQTSMLPSYVHARSQNDSVARTLASVALTWAALGPALVALVLVALAHYFPGLLAAGAGAVPPVELQHAFAALMWMAPLNAVADCGAMLLNAEGHFAAAAGAPLLNVAVGIAVLMLWRDAGLDALIWSLLSGLAAQALLILGALRHAAVPFGVQLRLAISLPRALSGVGLPVLLANVSGNLIPAFVQMVSARAGVGAMSAMGYASRLHNSLVQAVVMSVSTVLLPHFARLSFDGRTQELRHSLERIFASTWLFSVAVACFVAVSGEPLVRLLLQHGSFSAADARVVAAVWLGLTFGLLGTTWGIFLARLFQAQRRPWVIAASGGVSLLANAAFTLLLLPRWGVVGVAVANSMAYTVIMLMFHILAARRLGSLLAGEAWRFVLLALLANVGAYCVAGWCERWLPGLLWPVAVPALIVLLTNLAVARLAPLRLTLHSLVTLRE